MDITLPTIPAACSCCSPSSRRICRRSSSAPRAPVAEARPRSRARLVLTAVVLVFYYAYTGDVIPAWPVLVLLAIVVAQASYAMLTRNTAAVVERTLNAGPIGPDTLRRDLR